MYKVNEFAVFNQAGRGCSIFHILIFVHQLITHLRKLNNQFTQN